MTSKLFDYDNPFFSFMSRVWDLMILNFLAVLFSLPVITAGASATALYYVTLKMAEDRESHIYKSFLKSFRDNLRQSTVIHVIMCVAGAILIIDYRFFVLGNQGLPAFFLMAVLFMALPLIYLFILLYVYAVQARFINPVFRTLSNAFMMSIRHLPSTILMIILNLIFFYVAWNYALWLCFWVLSGPIYLNSLILCRVFKKYMKQPDT